MVRNALERAEAHDRTRVEALMSDSYDASDPVAENNLRRDARRIDRQDKDVLRKLMHTPEGRSWLYRKLETCHIYSSTFSAGQSDVTAFQLGEENIGKRLMLECQAASVDLYMKMIKERQEWEREQDVQREKEGKRREDLDRAPTVDELMPELPPPNYLGKPKKQR